MCYRLQGDSVHMEYSARTDRSTPINLTNHTYWNISGDFSRNIYEHSLRLACDHYLPVDDSQIPIGEVRPVENTAFDLRSGMNLGAVIPYVDGGGQPGLDHCFVINQSDSEETLTAAVRLESGSGAPEAVLRLVGVLTCATAAGTRELRAYATQPGVQIYTGNFLPITPTNDTPHRQHNAVCIETQHFPDSINHYHTPSDSYPVPPGHVLHPGEVYYQQSVYTIGNRQ